MKKSLKAWNLLWISLTSMIGSGCLLSYLIFIRIFSYLGNYGGKHMIPQYWDLLYLLGFSAIIFGLAYLSKKPNYHAQTALDQLPCYTSSVESIPNI